MASEDEPTTNFLENAIPYIVLAIIMLVYIVIKIIVKVVRG